MVSCDVACHVICDVIACVASCHVDAMRCHGDERFSVVPCNELKMPLVVRSVLLRTTTHHSSSTLYYTVLLQHYPVLQSTTPEQHGPTKCHNVLLQSYDYKEILQFYALPQNNTPAQICATKYYSGTTLYYTLPLCTTKHSSSIIFHFLMRAARVPGGPGQFAFQSAKHTQNGQVQKSVFKQQTSTSTVKPIQENELNQTKLNLPPQSSESMKRGPFRTQGIDGAQDKKEEMGAHRCHCRMTCDKRAHPEGRIGALITVLDDLKQVNHNKKPIIVR